MPVTIPELTPEQRRELDDLFANEELLAALDGMPLSWWEEEATDCAANEESDATILERQRQAIEAFSRQFAKEEKLAHEGGIAVVKIGHV